VRPRSPSGRHYQNSPLWGWQTITIGSKFPQAFGLFGGYASACYPLMKVKGVDALEAMRSDPSIDVTDPVAVMNERPFADADYTTSHTGLQFELAQPASSTWPAKAPAAATATCSSASRRASCVTCAAD